MDGESTINHEPAWGVFSSESNGSDSPTPRWVLLNPNICPLSKRMWWKRTQGRSENNWKYKCKSISGHYRTHEQLEQNLPSLTELTLCQLREQVNNSSCQKFFQMKALKTSPSQKNNKAGKNLYWTKTETHSCDWQAIGHGSVTQRWSRSLCDSQNSPPERLCCQDMSS